MPEHIFVPANDASLSETNASMSENNSSAPENDASMSENNSFAPENNSSVPASNASVSSTTQCGENSPSINDGRTRWIAGPCFGVGDAMLFPMAWRLWDRFEEEFECKCLKESEDVWR